MIRAAEDWDVRDLAHLKQQRGLTVSCVIPARNEERTVGEVVATVRRALVEDVPLVDELVVIDSDSTDATAAEARRAGATVHAARDIAPGGVRPVSGKGEALWKSQFVTTGELVTFLDADLTRWGSHFVSGVLAPMIEDERIALVKGVYERLAGGDDIDGSGARVPTGAQGGRVTELMARPLLNLWWPELSVIRQPLGGEWAIRRDVLAQLPVPTGYGVEVAVLVDVLERLGIDAIAQVDLGARGHHHQDLAALGAMALEVLAAAEVRRARTEGAGPVVRRDEVVPLTQYLGRAGMVETVVRSVRVSERPPAAGFAEFGGRR